MSKHLGSLAQSGIIAVVIFAMHATAAGQWQTGAARVSITPDSLMWMSGYGGRDKPSEGKLTELWAKALVLDDQTGDRAVLITLDLVGIDRGLSLAICQALHERYGLERRQIAICTSHTHTGPVVRRNLAPIHYLIVDDAQQRLIDQYSDTLQAKVVDVVGQALERLGPSRLTWGHGEATFAVNRRENRPEESVREWRTQGTLKGPSDHDVPVLAIRDPDGKLKTVLFGYACHATVLSFFQWSGDYPAFAQMELEDRNPGCLAMFWAGCGADQNPLPRRTVALAQHYGRRLATAVEAVLLTSQMNEVRENLRTSYREIDLPFATLPNRDELVQQAQASNRYAAARAKLLLAQLDAGQPLSPTYPYPVAAWQLGDDIQLVILGGEVVVDYALRLKAELSAAKTWVASYSNDVMAYIPSRRVLIEGGYEGGGAMEVYGLPSAWAPSVEEMIVGEVKAQVAALAGE